MTSESGNGLPTLLKTQDVCKYLNMSKWGIYKWVREGKLTPKANMSKRMGMRFTLEDVNKAAGIKEESPFD